MNVAKNVGGLYRLKSSLKIDRHCPVRFCFVMNDIIHNETYWNNRFPVSHETLPLMLIKTDMILTTETAGAGEAPGRAGAVLAVMMSTLATLATAVDDHDLARKQFVNKFVPGSVFMVPDGQLIWMSDIDFKYFEEVDL